MAPPPPQQQLQASRITNPRHLLILTPTSHSLTTIPPLLNSLTGTPVRDPLRPTPPVTDPAADPNPTKPPQPTFAGYTAHPPLPLSNKYYSAEIPIWVDEIPLSHAVPEEEDEEASTEILTPSTWKTEFSGEEAKVVRDAIGAVVICIRNLESKSKSTGEDVEGREDWKALKEFLGAIGFVKGVMDEERGGMGDVLGLVVLVGRERGGVMVPGFGPGAGGDQVGELMDDEEPFSGPWWEDRLYDLGLMGFEVVGWDPKGGEGGERNQFGEYRGMRRIREILETHDWASLSSGDADGADDDDELERHLLGLGEDGFDLEVNELEREMVGLRFAMENGDDDLGGFAGDDEMKVESMEALMMRMKAIKDMSDELPENERKRFAAKAVRDIMKEL